MSSASDPSIVFSAERIATILAVPPAPPRIPTAEQRRVIEHGVGGSTLVVAGAGSGKTETMAGRVVWLVANGLAAPEQVLGLTFTRKAAGELRERISGRLEIFGDRVRDLAERGQLSEAEAARAAELEDVLGAGLDIPDVSTYNSFAAGVLQEFGPAAGIAPGAVVIDEAMAWRIAREVVISSRDPELAGSELRVPELVKHLLALDHAVADNLTSLDRVDQVVSEFTRVQALPYNEKGRPADEGKLYADVRNALSRLAETPLITRLARDYADQKRRRGLIEFSDQLALATRSLERFPDGIAALRRRHRVVLLDEVQDTSVGQTRLLSMIFGGASVMAVGDPHQSIYGWRGASAEGLRSFHADFAGRGADRPGDRTGPADTLTLSTSWRNPELVLEAAGVIAAPLAADAAIDVPRLAARPGASSGTLEWRYPETLHEERQAVAQWMREAREAHREAHGEEASAAIIFRSRRPMAAFAATLDEFGVPNRIVGLGGLLTTPEVTDVVSALRCLWYADANGELLRILAGPRFRLGVADLAGLGHAARWFAERDVSQKRLSDEDRLADRVLPDPDRAFTLVDALDEIARMRDLDHRALERVTPEGRERLREAGRMLQSLRQWIGGDFSELVTAIVQALRIDIELDANEASPLAGTSGAHANLDSFVDVAEGFLAIDERGTLASLLEWIERATEADEAAEHVAAPDPGTVQLITAHGSKGLEWDLVVLPRLVSGEFPGPARDGDGWLRRGQIPDELRGDAGARPELNWRIATTQKELKERMADYRQELRDRHAVEERRLAYVAVTRAAERLLLTGSFWGGQTKPRGPSEFLTELQEAGLISGLPLTSAYESDPSDVAELTVDWPLDPLGGRAGAVSAASRTLRAALEGRSKDPADPRVRGADDDLAPERVDEGVRLLLGERRRARSKTAAGETSAGDEALPERLTASTFHEFIEDPVRAERQRLRPIPQRPYRRTRTGNRFHEWVERRATTAVGTALALPGLDPETPDAGRLEFDTEADLQPLIESFERSRWASLQPIAVEQEVTLPFAGRTLVCKLDAVYRIDDPDASGHSGGPEAFAHAESAGPRYEVVDWKSGRPPRTPEERASRFFQLDLYRHAYAQWSGVDPERISVSLFYVADGVELTGDRPRSLAELEEAWLEAAGRIRGEEGDGTGNG